MTVHGHLAVHTVVHSSDALDLCQRTNGDPGTLESPGNTKFGADQVREDTSVLVRKWLSKPCSPVHELLNLLLLQIIYIRELSRTKEGYPDQRTTVK